MELSLWHAAPPFMSIAMVFNQRSLVRPDEGVFFCLDVGEFPEFLEVYLKATLAVAEDATTGSP